jgi:hypothetical protein
MNLLGDPAAFRRSLYWLLIAVSAGVMTGRVLAVNSVDQIALEKQLRQKQPERTLQRPFLSGNDRSRWDTVRALVEHGTYSIDEIVHQPGWDTIDMVQHRDRQGRLRLYSSKPPLFATLMAGPYWVVHKLTGATLGTHPYEIGRGMILVLNVLPMLLYLWVVGRLAERFGATDWGRLFVVAAAAFGTFLTTFVVVINNHLPAAVCVAAALALAARIVLDGDQRPWVSALCGLMAAFAVVNELPALAFFALVAAVLLWRTPRPALLGFVPAAVLVAAAYLGTNYLAHDSLRPPYAHRQDGAKLFEAESSLAAALDQGRLPDELRAAFAGHDLPLGGEIEVEPDVAGKRWVLLDRPAGQKYAVVAEGNVLAVRAWDNWYDYTFERGGRKIESYWKRPENRSKIDRGEADRGVYAFHVLVGHHGIFSLTPLWLLAPVGLSIWAFSGSREQKLSAAGILLVSVVCVAFFLLRPLQDRNYGGMTSGFRWVFWLAPLWLVAILPAADWLAKRRPSRGVGLVLLALSALSASYPTWNPWTQPWLTNLWVYLRWADF